MTNEDMIVQLSAQIEQGYLTYSGDIGRLVDERRMQFEILEDAGLLGEMVMWKNGEPLLGTALLTEGNTVSSSAAFCLHVSGAEKDGILDQTKVEEVTNALKDRGMYEEVNEITSYIDNKQSATNTVKGLEKEYTEVIKPEDNTSVSINIKPE